MTGIPIYKAPVRCAADKDHEYSIRLPSTPFFLPETEMISAWFQRTLGINNHD